MAKTYKVHIRSSVDGRRDMCSYRQAYNWYPESVYRGADVNFEMAKTYKEQKVADVSTPSVVKTSVMKDEFVAFPGKHMAPSCRPVDEPPIETGEMIVKTTASQEQFRAPPAGSAPRRAKAPKEFGTLSNVELPF